jgi:dTDP-4-dehydrorhamnose reductase
MKPMAGSILIVGSSGMLGTDLCQELDGDYEVYGIDNRSRAGLNLPYNSTPIAQRYFECDITDKKSVSEVISKVRPEIVIHTAAMTDVDGCERDSKKAYAINSTGTENVALACKDIGAAMFYISTDFVFDGTKSEPYVETDAPSALSVYGKSKLKGEEAVQRNVKKYFILRTSWLYGKNGKNFVDTIIKNSKTEAELKVVNDQVGSPTYTKDLSMAIHKLLDGSFSKYGIYHVSNAGAVSWFEYAKAILKLSGSNTKVSPISSQDLNRPAKRPAMSVLDNSKFAALTGYKMRGWEEALKEYISC